MLRQGPCPVFVCAPVRNKNVARKRGHGRDGALRKFLRKVSDRFRCSARDENHLLLVFAEVTGDPPRKILGWFFRTGFKLNEIGMSNAKAGSCNAERQRTTEFI